MKWTFVTAYQNSSQCGERLFACIYNNYFLEVALFESGSRKRDSSEISIIRGKKRRSRARKGSINFWGFPCISADRTCFEIGIPEHYYVYAVDSGNPDEFSCRIWLEIFFAEAVRSFREAFGRVRTSLTSFSRGANRNVHRPESWGSGFGETMEPGNKGSSTAKETTVKYSHFWQRQWMAP